MQTYEVEVKSLLGDAEHADKLRKALKAVDPKCELESKNGQLNHYFEGGSLAELVKALSPHMSPYNEIKLEDLAQRAIEFSVRTRDKDGSVFFVVKASVGADSSANGVSRIEIEEKLPLSLKELDDLILKNGFKYQAKWSREREEYFCKGVNVTLDKNAGYGWLAEFERVVDDAGKVENAHKEIAALMQELGVEELPQARLERMFAHYNKHWQEYYGTEKIFVVE